MTRDLNLRNTFDSDAELYQARRPLYPDELFQILVEETKLNKSAHLLEIGPGTGQATTPFAKQGYRITAIELGGELFKVAKEQLGKFPNVELIQGDFEDFEFPSSQFDLIYAATAFHWLTPRAQFEKTHNLLKKNGHLAIIEAVHVSDEAGDDFFEVSQEVYKKYAVGTYSKPTLPKTADLKPFETDKNLFELVRYEKFPAQIAYSAEEYAQLLSTYSDVIARRPNNQASFLNAMHDLIEKDFNGTVTKSYAMTLTLAQKKLLTTTF